jgi:TatA/E family protein of Tat protein translocase
MFGIGSQELMIILLIAFIIFGAKRLPELGGSLGQAIRSFKKAVSGEEEKFLGNEKKESDVGKEKKDL